jgi:rare lipoprotein A (peptidoglycan hydrolase)
MNRFCFIFFIVFAKGLTAQTDSVVVSFDSIPAAIADTINKQPISSTPKINIDTTYTETGIASWYGEKFEGRYTSSGEIYRLDSLTAAHKKLPFGTLVRVTNLKNDSIVVVKITDRLPQNSKRCIDLTPRAARQLNFVNSGLTKVKIEVIGKAPLHLQKRKLISQTGISNPKK